MANHRSLKFKKALEEMEAYKNTLELALIGGDITEEEYNYLLQNKAEELDL